MKEILSNWFLRRAEVALFPYLERAYEFPQEWVLGWRESPSSTCPDSKSPACKLGDWTQEARLAVLVDL